MIKKFKDFDVEQYKKYSLYESLDMSIENGGIDESLLNVPIGDDRYLVKITRIILNAFDKRGIKNYVPYGYTVYINGVPGVLFQNDDNERNCIVVCRTEYVKTIHVFDDFEFGHDNKARVTYTSEKLGFTDMINELIENISGGLNEGILFEAKSGKGIGYSSKHIKIVAGWNSKMKEYVVKGLESMNPYKLSERIKMNASTDEICRDIVDSLSASTIKYGTYIIQHALDGDYSEFPELEYVLDDKMKAGAKPALTTSFGEDIDVEDYIAEKEERRKKEIEEQTKKFNDDIQTIKDITDTFCHYVKQNGILDDNDRSAFLSRGLYITGKAGVGKSHTVKEVLEKNNMIEKRDYYNVGTAPTTATELYKKMYKNNGKLIIFDDSSKIVSGANRIAFWKGVLQTDPEPVRYPREIGDNNNQFYEVGKKSRQQRYYAEIGEKSKEEKEEFMRKKDKAWKTSKGDFESYKDFRSLAEQEWEDMKKNTKELIPDEFTFEGCVIIIGNMSPAELQKDVMTYGGKRDWDAIRQRFQPIEMNPPAEAVWATIQKQIREQQAKSEDELPDSMCIVPRDYVDDFISEVNRLLSGDEGPNYTSISWRMASQIGTALKGDKGRRMWKSRLKEIMLETSN